MSEKELTSQLLRKIRATFPGVFCWKTHDMFHAGIPDIIGCYSGVFFGFEVKFLAGRVEKIQSHVIKQIEEAGGVAGIVRGWEDVRILMLKVVEKSQGGLDVSSR